MGIVNHPRNLNSGDHLARLVRLICLRHADDGIDDIFKACISIALEHDLNDDETQRLISGVETGLGVTLIPFNKCA